MRRCAASRCDARTHDLAALSQAILDSGQALPVTVDELRALNPFAVEFRYDDEITPSMTREELRARLSAVEVWAVHCIEGSEPVPPTD